MAESRARIAAVFRALADPTRLRIVDLIASKPGITLQELAGHFEVSRFAVMKHLNVLEKAGLLRRQREGNAKLLELDTTAIILIRDGWLARF